MAWDIHGSGKTIYDISSIGAIVSVILWYCGISFIGVKVSLGLAKIDS